MRLIEEDREKNISAVDDQHRSELCRFELRRKEGALLKRRENKYQRKQKSEEKHHRVVEQPVENVEIPWLNAV